MNLPDVKVPQSGTNYFLKLKDKESIRGVFVGEVHHFYIKWVGNKSVEATENDPDGKVRFRCNFIAPASDGVLAVKVWDFPYSVFIQIKGINAEYPLEKTKVKITRLGSGTETQYQIMPLLGQKDILTDEQLSAIKSLQLHQLDKKSKKTESDSFNFQDAPPFPSEYESEIPF